jgi:hypothetical protein
VGSKTFEGTHVPPEAENAVGGSAGMHAVQALTDGGNGSAQIGVGAESESCGDCEAGLSSQDKRLNPEVFLYLNQAYLQSFYGSLGEARLWKAVWHRRWMGAKRKSPIRGKNGRSSGSAATSIPKAARYAPRSAVFMTC